MSDLAVPIAYDNWATERLARFVATLSPEQRALTTPGTMGTAEATLIHLVAAKERYAAALAGSPSPDDAVHETKQQSLEHVVARAEALGRWFDGFANGTLDLDRLVERKTPAGVKHVPLRIVVTQLLHHGNEHRAQLGSIFGVHGVVAPHCSAFAWGEEQAKTG